MSKKAKKAFKKAVRQKNRRRRGSWLLIQKGDSIKEVLSKLITQTAVLVLAACGVILANELRLSLSAKQLNTDISQIYFNYIGEVNDTIDRIGNFIKPDTEPVPLQGAQQLLAINPDTVGYVMIDGTDISLPVVQRKTSDGNKYYLKTAFDGSANKAGTVFLDYRATLTASERSDVLTLYGHNQRDLTMFGQLKNYKHNIDYYKEHPIITFCSNYQMDTYKIFAYFVAETKPEQVRDGEVFDYHNYIDLDRDKYEKFIGNVMERSQITTSVDVEYGDEFLVLSTCSNEFEDSRFAVFARKTRKGESSETDTSSAALNPNAKEPDWNYIYK